MLPIDLRFVQQRASQALGFLAEALQEQAASPLRTLLLNAMNAVDDIEASVECAFDIAVAVVEHTAEVDGCDDSSFTNNDIKLTLVA